MTKVPIFWGFSTQAFIANADDMSMFEAYLKSNQFNSQDITSFPINQIGSKISKSVQKRWGAKDKNIFDYGFKYGEDYIGHPTKDAITKWLKLKMKK